MKTFSAWGIELDDYDRGFLVGIGYSSDLTGGDADWSNPVTTLMFKTRSEARQALARYRKRHPWWFSKRAWHGGNRLGGNRLYRSGRVVRLTVSVEVSA